jgi:hypothetical protein
LRCEKVLLDAPAITKRRTAKSAKSTIDSVLLDELTLSEELISSEELTSSKELTPSELISSEGLTSSKESSASSTPSTSITSAISLAQFILAIIEGYKTDIQFSKALTASVESSIYLLDAEELLYLAMLDGRRLCILDTKIRKRRATNFRELLISHAHDIIAHRAYRLTN